MGAGRTSGSIRPRQCPSHAVLSTSGPPPVPPEASSGGPAKGNPARVKRVNRARNIRVAARLRACRARPQPWLHSSRVRRARGPLVSKQILSR
jgi:hypothetical protein